MKIQQAMVTVASPFNIQKEFVKCSGSSVPEEKVLANLYSKIWHYNCHKITLEVTDVAIKSYDQIGEEKVLQVKETQTSY